MNVLDVARFPDLDQEFQSLHGEIDRLASDVTYNGLRLLCARGVTHRIPCGIEERQAIVIELPDVRTCELGLDGSVLVDGDEPLQTLGSLEAALGAVSAERGRLHSTLADLRRERETVERTRVTLSTPDVQVADEAVALTAARITRAALLQRTGISILAQANADSNAAVAVLADDLP